jgi:hypothetical protein
VSLVLAYYDLLIVLAQVYFYIEFDITLGVIKLLLIVPFISLSSIVFSL